MNRNHSYDRDDEERKPKVPKECPWCGSSRKRPRNHKENGACNEKCHKSYRNYMDQYSMTALRGRR